MTVGREKPGSGPGRNRAAQSWVVLLAVVAVVTGLLFVYTAVVAALLGGVPALALTIVVWLVLIGTPAALLKRARTRDKGVL